MITYNLAPVPLWNLRDNSGEPLSNGYMKAYRNDVRSQFKPVYSNPAGTVAYLQPIIFNAAGYQGPFYWASDENYYLEIYDSNNVLVRTIPDYNAPQDGGVTPITTNVDFINYILNSQFNYPIFTPLSPLVGGTTYSIVNQNWFFIKNNSTATDAINIYDTIPGQTVPPNNPFHYFQYECSVAGSSEVQKDLYYRWLNSNTFQNEQITFGFWADSPSSSTIEILFWQNFGPGSISPDVLTPIVSFNTVPGWNQYSDTFVVPTITGKVLGSNPGFAALIFRLPLNQTCQINITNVQVNIGNNLLPFEELPVNSVTPLQIPPYYYGENLNSFLGISSSNQLNWFPVTNIIPTQSPNTYLTSNGANVLTWSPIPVLYYFNGTSAQTAVGTSYAIMPLNPTLNPNGWISGNQFQPNTPLTALVTFYVFVNSSAAGVEVESSIFFNTTKVQSGSFFINAIGGSGEFCISQVLQFNGTSDHVTFQSVATSNGVAQNESPFFTIKVLSYP